MTRAATGLVALCWAGWDGTLRWQSTAAHAGVPGAIAAVVVIALAGGHGRQLSDSRAFAGEAVRAVRRGLRRPSLAAALVLGWVLLAAAVLAWDLNSLLAASRRLPTLSRLSGELTRHEAGRAALGLAWITLGTAIALGRRAPARPAAAKARRSAPRRPPAEVGDASAAGGC